MRCINGGMGNFDFSDSLNPIKRGCVLTHVCYKHSTKTWSLFDLDEDDQSFIRRRRLLDIGNTIVSSKRTTERIPLDRLDHFANRRNVKHSEVTIFLLPVKLVLFVGQVGNTTSSSSDITKGGSLLLAFATTNK